MEAPGGAEPPSLETDDTALLALDRAPLPGILQVTNGVQTYWPNHGDGRWGEARPVGETPTISSFGESGVLFADADGSATSDMLVAGSQPLHGYFENGGDEGWTRFVAYPEGHAAAPPWSSGQVRLMDDDGDGPGRRDLEWQRRVHRVAQRRRGRLVGAAGSPDRER